MTEEDQLYYKPIDCCKTERMICKINRILDVESRNVTVITSNDDYFNRLVAGVPKKCRNRLKRIKD